MCVGVCVFEKGGDCLLTGPVCPPPPSVAPSPFCSWSESDGDGHDASHELALTPRSLLSGTHTHTHKYFIMSSLLTYDPVKPLLGKNNVKSLSCV